jgi:hypothetical protein
MIRRFRLERPLKYLVKSALWRVAPRYFSRRTIPREYSIAIYTGDSPFDLRPSPHANNPVISRKDATDVPITIAADPFISRLDGVWHMHFEVMNQLSWKGEIAYATSANGYDWRYEGLALREPFHMSYPQVFEWQSEMYMVPETGRARAVRLYRATRFPDRWVHAATLLEGGRFADSSLFRFDGKWWMLTDTGLDSASPILRLFFASELTGPWREHQLSPIVDADKRLARPAGRVIIVDGRPVRFAQPAMPDYGTEVRALEITELSTSQYCERQVGDAPILGAGSETWNSGGMHHIDAHKLPDGSWLACVDGWRSSARGTNVTS